MEFVRLSKWGNSNAIRIPKNILKNLSISENDSDVEFELSINDNSQIILTKRAEEENYLEMLFKNYEVTEKDRVDFDWGEPRGIEIL
jgi:antitoxin MazE